MQWNIWLIKQKTKVHNKVLKKKYSETGIKNASELFRWNVVRIHMAMEG